MDTTHVFAFLQKKKILHVDPVVRKEGRKKDYLVAKEEIWDLAYERFQ